MLLLGIDIGTSSVKVAVIDSSNSKTIASTQFPETEEEIISVRPGWAEQNPEIWWLNVQAAIHKLHAFKKYDPNNIVAIGITYQMHGLVLIDKDQNILRNSIIWCDSRAVPYGEAAFHSIGNFKCLNSLLNSPGNFTASKLAWVKEKESGIYNRINKVLLPGDYISMKLTGICTTTVSALSEGVFYDFQENELSKDVFQYFGFETSFIPDIVPVFFNHGNLKKEVSENLSLKEGIPVTYKAGDQPNNALSLNVLEPGEVAANAGTSGVIYAVSDECTYDAQSRVNSFAHVNYSKENIRIGVLLCINGTGILNKWVKNLIGRDYTYDELNTMAEKIPAGSDGLVVLPFGNGAERMLGNKHIGAHIENLDFNLHTPAHLYHASQEGIAFAFRYGLDIIRANRMNPKVIRAGKTNMFLSNVFTQSFVNATGIPIELYDNDGSMGAALGAGIGAGIFKDAKEAFSNLQCLQKVEPNKVGDYELLYEHWKIYLTRQIQLV